MLISFLGVLMVLAALISFVLFIIRKDKDRIMPTLLAATFGVFLFILGQTIEEAKNNPEVESEEVETTVQNIDGYNLDKLTFDLPKDDTDIIEFEVVMALKTRVGIEWNIENDLVHYYVLPKNGPLSDAELEATSKYIVENVKKHVDFSTVIIDYVNSKYAVSNYYGKALYAYEGSQSLSTKNNKENNFENYEYVFTYKNNNYESSSEENDSSEELPENSDEALNKANEYLKTDTYSKAKLQSRLLKDEFSEDNATYAVENVDVDWNNLALEKAQEYRDYKDFTDQEVFDLLLYEKFTDEQAQFAVDNMK